MTTRYDNKAPFAERKLQVGDVTEFTQTNAKMAGAIHVTSTGCKYIWFEYEIDKTKRI